MIRIDPDIWERLSGPRPTGDKLIARLASPEFSDILYVAVDSEGIRHLLIQLKDIDEPFRDNQSRGLIAETHELVVAGQHPIRYIDIECRDPSGHSILDLIGGEIVDGLTKTELQTGLIVGRVLAKWRRFWGNIPQQSLSREAQIGLFAELWFLHQWLIPRFGSDSVVAWKGPWGSRHDFEWPEKSVEVKATSTSTGRLFHIKDLQQLESPDNGNLYLFGMSLWEETGAVNTLPALVGKTRESIATDPEALSYYENSLIQVGYSPVHEDQYLRIHYHISEALLFVVDESFPKITRDDFPQGKLNGIEKVEYKINLNGKNELIVASIPDEMPF